MRQLHDFVDLAADVDSRFVALFGGSFQRLRRHSRWRPRATMVRRQVRFDNDGLKSGTPLSSFELFWDLLNDIW